MSSIKEKELDYKLTVEHMRWQNFIKLVKIIGPLLVLYFLGSQFIEQLPAFAGKNTEANMVIQIITKLNASKWVGYVVGLGGLLYGKMRNNQRKRLIRSSGEHISVIEKKIDPNRGSSNLTKTGETNDKYK